MFEHSLQDLAQSLQSVAPAFALVVCRIGGMMVFAPLLGSAKIPRRVKVLFTIILALGIAQGIALPAKIPQTTWELAIGIGGEIAFGLAMGTILSLVFIAAQWAGEIIGQQMGLNLSEVFDPQFGQAGSLIGDMYFMLTLVIFLTIGGERALLTGVRASFDALPLLSVGLDRSLFDLLTGLLTSATMLAIQLAGPMLVTMLVVDLSLGCISKTVPQLNIMTAGMAVRSLVGLIVLYVGINLTADVLQWATSGAMRTVQLQYATPAPTQ
jgi:flagellar biosynthetic protein FliR